MTFRDFRNALCVLKNIDFHELVDAGALRRDDAQAWGWFVTNPYDFLIKADDRVAAAIWSIVERRMTR